MAGPHTPSPLRVEDEDTEWQDVFGSDSEEPSSSADTPAIVSAEEEKMEPIAPSTPPPDHEERKAELVQEVEAKEVVTKPPVKKIPSPAKKPRKKKMAVFQQRTEKCEEELTAGFLRTSPDKEDLSALKEAMHRLKGLSDEAVEATPWAHYPHNILLYWQGGRGEAGREGGARSVYVYSLTGSHA